MGTTQRVEMGELVAIRTNLDRFLKQFDGCIRSARSRKHLRVYVGGQVGDLPRKSIEPIALEARVAPRTLQEFLGLHRWDEWGMRDRLQQVVMEQHADAEAIAVVDDTGHLKKGKDTVGVQPQYYGLTGKTANCVVTVHLSYATEDFYTLVDADLFLPESWANDPQRRRRARIPDAVQYRPKWQIGLDELDHAIANGMRFRWLTADESYGRIVKFRQGVAAHGLTYMVEIPCSTKAWRDRPLLRGSASGYRRSHKTRSYPRPCRVDQFFPDGSGPAWQRFHVKTTGKGPVVWEVRATRIYPWEGYSVGEPLWLIIARSLIDGEVKYFYSNAPASAKMEDLLRVAFRRWTIERLFEDAKGEVGLDHFEVRRYLPVMRHLIISMVSLLFLASQTHRLREKKCVVEPLAGGGSTEHATRRRLPPPGTTAPTEKGGRQNHLLANPRRRISPMSLQEDPEVANSPWHRPGQTAQVF